MWIFSSPCRSLSQVQLEVADLDQCYFVQWQPAHLAPDNEEVFSIIVVERDRRWFAENVGRLHAFWKDLMDARAAHVPPPPPQCLIDLELYSNPLIYDDSGDFTTPIITSPLGCSTTMVGVGGVVGGDVGA